MPRTRRSRSPYAAALALVVLPAPIGPAGPVQAPARAADPVAPTAHERVRLVAEPAAGVRAAEVGLGRGVTRLETTAYSMLAATWRGADPVVEVRTTADGPWRVLPVLHDGPSRGDGEGRPGVHGTDLVWAGPSRGVDVRVSGTGHRDLELVLIEPGEDPVTTPLSRAGTAARGPAATTRQRARAGAEPAPRPALLTRRDWGANPRWRNGRPEYTRGLRQVHVHHTATGNRYSRADVPGLIRGMYRYHTQSLGWFDLGYNFLVDRFGRTWVGRSGGPDRLVRGAHTLGFNERSVGVAVIGTMTSRKPWRPAVGAVVRLAAWKLDRHGRDATGKVRVTSTGSDRYRKGARVRLPVIDGHRDTNETACPGQRLYDRLPSIRRRAQARIARFG